MFISQDQNKASQRLFSNSIYVSFEFIHVDWTIQILRVCIFIKKRKVLLRIDKLKRQYSQGKEITCMLFKGGKRVKESVKFLRRRKALELFVFLKDRLFLSDDEWIFKFHLFFINHNIAEIHSSVFFLDLLDVIQSLGNSSHNVLDFVLTESLVLDPAMRQIIFEWCACSEG